MTALIIDTSTFEMLLGISKDKNLLQSEVRLHGNRISEQLMPSICASLEKCDLKFSDLKYIAVGIGPGSYTGVRVGLSVAKTLSFALDIPLIGFCSYLCFTPNEEGTFAVVTFPKNGSAHIVQGTKDINNFLINQKTDIIPISELGKVLTNVTNIVSDTPELLEKHLPGTKCQMPVANIPFLAAVAHERFLQKDYSLDGEVQAIYYQPTNF